MLSETHEMESLYPANEVNVPDEAGFVVGMAIGQVNLIVFVSDDTSGSGSVGDGSRADLLAAVMRLIPQGDPMRVLNVGVGKLRYVFARFRDTAGPDRCLFLDLRTSADPVIAELARALRKEWMMPSGTLWLRRWAGDSDPLPEPRLLGSLSAEG